MATERKPRPGRFAVARIDGEWHVVFEPDDLRWHFLSVARFQDRGRAVLYAETEDMMAIDDCPPQADAVAMAAVADPRAGDVRAQPIEPRSEPAFKPEEITEKPSADRVLRDDSTVEEIAGDPQPPAPSEEVEKASIAKPISPVIAASAEKPAKPPTETQAQAKERALDHYAEHGGTHAEIAVRVGVPLGSLSGYLSLARKAGDPRIAAGDAKREMTPHLARLIGAPTPTIEPAKVNTTREEVPPVVKTAPGSQPVAQVPDAAPDAVADRPSRPYAPPKGQPLPVLPERSTAPKPEPVTRLAEPGRKLTHREMVEAARKAVPAPTFSRPGGATVRTG